MRAGSPVVAAVAGLSLTLAACSVGEGGPGPTAAQSTSDPSMGNSEEGGDPASPTVTEGSTGTGDSGDSSSAGDGGSPSSSEGDGDSPSSSSTTPSSTSTDTGKPFDPEEFTGRLEAAVEEDPTARIDLEMTVDGRVAVSAKGVQDLADEALDMEVEIGDQELGYLLVDGNYYLAQPPKWVPVTRDSENPVVRQTLDQIQVLSMRNQFDAFVAGVEDAGIKGEETVGGVSTTHYTATVDTTTSMAELGVEKDEGMPDSVVYDVWLDSKDRIRKISFDLDNATTTLTASDWGEPVDIEEPEPSELAEAPEVGTP